jgi:hypothetical protein
MKTRFLSFSFWVQQHIIRFLRQQVFRRIQHLQQHQRRRQRLHQLQPQQQPLSLAVNENHILINIYEICLATSTTTTTTESIPDATVIYPKDMENQCVQPVAIAAAIITAVMVPLHLYAMINLFVKVNSMFQKEALQARNARHMRLRSAKYRQEEEETLV